MVGTTRFITFLNFSNLDVKYNQNALQRLQGKITYFHTTFLVRFEVIFWKIRELWRAIELRDRVVWTNRFQKWNKHVKNSKHQ